MKIKRYLAPNFQSAIEKVKIDLGKDAIILRTKRRKKGGLLGFFGKELVEITAALGDSAQIRPVPNLPATGSFPPGDMLSNLQQELRELKKMVAGIASSQHSPMQIGGELLKAYRLLTDINNRLLHNGVTDANAAKILKELINQLPENALDDQQQVQGTIEHIIAAQLNLCMPINLTNGLQIVALVGPTGVGKTTTIAKLAAKFALHENKDVALITTDTYRIAAVEQLRRYAEIMDLPLEVVYAAAELKQAINRHKEKKLILIDTAGSSQHNVLQLSQLRDMLQYSAHLRTYLVLSLTTKYSDLLDIVQKFQRVKYDALLLTKMDETTSYGSILNIVMDTEKPFSYITTGQSVPDDIEPFQPLKMAKYILGER
ncbi:MAG: flagellar biosynthesis protein FlhF [bacterium]|jgi:flagellar biosynthesis protein FlhF